MMRSSQNETKSQKGSWRGYWILCSIAIVFMLISYSIWDLIPSALFPLYALTASAIVILNGILLEILKLSPNVVERRIVAIIILVLGIRGLYSSWAIWSGTLSPSKVDSMGMSIGWLASFLSSVLLFHYLRKQKIIQ